MSNLSWIEWKKNTWQRLRARDKSPRFAVLGIGNEFNGDDAAGVLVARHLQKKLGEVLRKEGRELKMESSSFLSAGILVIDAGLAPENFSGNLRRFKPDILLLVDAADMAEPPGYWALIDWRSASGFGASTHLQPLSTFGEYLFVELGCEMILLGIQPAQNQFDHPVSEAVRAAVDTLVGDLSQMLVGWQVV